MSLRKHAIPAVLGAAILTTGPAFGGGDDDVILSGLVLPIGLEADAGGRLWVSEMGVNPKGPAAPGIGRVSMLAANLDGSFTLVPLIENIPTAFNSLGEPSGAQHISFAPDGSLLLATGGPNVPEVFPYLGSVVRFDPSYAVLAAGPYAIDGAALIESVPVFPFVRQEAGFPDSNTYSAAEIDGVLWIADAGANAIISYDGTDYAVLAEFPNTVNPKGTTPPTSQAVPTRIVPDGDGGAYVVQLTGFPFVDGTASVFRLSADGNYTTVATGLKTLVDIEVAADGSLLVCSAGDFDPATGQPTPGTGSVIRVRQDGSFDTFIGGLWLPTGVEVIGDDVYVCQFVPGTVTRYPGIAPRPCPGDLNHDGMVNGADMGLLLGYWGSCF